jgi:Tfp pilus assembly protein PilF
MTANDPSGGIHAARRALKEERADAAEAIADEILGDTPDDVDALEVKGLAAIDRGDDQAAEQALRRAIAVAPDRRWPYADLARLLLKLQRDAEAEDVATAALAVDPKNPDAHALLGSLLAEREQWMDAAQHFERAIGFIGNHPKLLAGLGHARMRSGKLEEARLLLEAATAADPSALEPAVYLAEVHERTGRFADAQRQLDIAEDIARKQGTDVDLQRSVLLARMGDTERALALLEGSSDLSGAARLQRGRLYDRLGRYAEAWDDWVAGKAQLAERHSRHYATEEVTRRAERVAAIGGRLGRAQRRDDAPQPIFIVGFPRSGTTLVEQILASHSAIIAGGELPFGAELSELVDASAERMRDGYLSRAGEYGLLRGAQFFTDKMPDNAFWLPLLRAAFPESPVIHVRRHPLDTLTSVMSHDMTHGFNCGYRVEDAARHLALVDDLLEEYRGAILELRYESLVADQAGETERLMAAVGLPMEAKQLRFHERDEVSPTPSYAQVQQPLNDRAIGRWRNYAAELEPVRSVVAAAMARGGYAD